MTPSELKRLQKSFEKKRGACAVEKTESEMEAIEEKTWKEVKLLAICLTVIATLCLSLSMWR